MAAHPNINTLASVYTPRQVAEYTYELLVARQDKGRVSCGTAVSSLDSALNPLLPGELCVVMANTSHYKTGFMSAWARSIASRITCDTEGKPAEIVVYVSWETAVEELGAMDFARMTGLAGAYLWNGALTLEDMRCLRGSLEQRARAPLWVLGVSLRRRRKQAPLTLPSVSESLEAVENTYTLTAACIFLDYLQEIPAPKAGDRREQMIANMEQAKQLARDCGCPVVIGVQAGRQVLERDFKLPQLGDGQETSRIEQAADKVLTLWLPRNTEQLGTTLPQLGLEVSDNLLVVGIQKQRFGRAGKIIPVYVNFDSNSLAPLVRETLE